MFLFRESKIMQVENFKDCINEQGEFYQRILDEVVIKRMIGKQNGSFDDILSLFF